MKDVLKYALVGFVVVLVVNGFYEDEPQSTTHLKKEENHPTHVTLTYDEYKKQCKPYANRYKGDEILKTKKEPKKIISGNPHANDYGEIEILYENGELKAEGTIKKGVKSGEYTEYFKGGHIKYTGNYQHGEKHGEFATYWQPEVIKSLEIFRYNKREGLSKYYDKSGKLISQREYKNGLQHGMTKTFDPKTGKVLVQQEYENGHVKRAK